VFLNQKNLAITGHEAHKSISTAADIATENEMIQMSPQSVQPPVDVPFVLGIRRLRSDSRFLIAFRLFLRTVVNTFIFINNKVAVRLAPACCRQRPRAVTSAMLHVRPRNLNVAEHIIMSGGPRTIHKNPRITHLSVLLNSPWGSNLNPNPEHMRSYSNLIRPSPDTEITSPVGKPAASTVRGPRVETEEHLGSRISQDLPDMFLTDALPPTQGMIQTMTITWHGYDGARIGGLPNPDAAPNKPMHAAHTNMSEHTVALRLFVDGEEPSCPRPLFAVKRANGAIPRRRIHTAAPRNALVSLPTASFPETSMAVGVAPFVTAWPFLSALADG
jgi:hypothetical protein